MMKKAFYFILKAVFVLVLVHSRPDLLLKEKKRLQKKVMINFKIYDVTNCTVINYSTYTAQSGYEIW